jgi:hypothetical protein
MRESGRVCPQVPLNTQNVYELGGIGTRPNQSPMLPRELSGRERGPVAGDGGAPSTPEWPSRAYFRWIRRSSPNDRVDLH